MQTETNINPYDKTLDQPRLSRQLDRVRHLMLDGRWRTLFEIAREIEQPEASISARLRDLRKPKNGSLSVDRRRRGEPSLGVWEYRVINPLAAPQLRIFG